MLVHLPWPMVGRWSCCVSPAPPRNPITKKVKKYENNVATSSNNFLNYNAWVIGVKTISGFFSSITLSMERSFWLFLCRGAVWWWGRKGEKHKFTAWRHVAVNAEILINDDSISENEISWPFDLVQCCVSRVSNSVLEWSVGVFCRCVLKVWFLLFPWSFSLSVPFTLSGAYLSVTHPHAHTYIIHTYQILYSP